jgi:hypothetical protein
MYSICMLTCEVLGETSEFQTLQTGRIDFSAFSDPCQRNYQITICLKNLNL